MCEPCREKSRRLHDVERRCDRPGCTGTWTWTAAAQLEAFAGDRPPPKRLCASCQSQLDSLEEKEVPCSVPGCARTAILTREQQLLSQGEPDAPPEPAKPGALTLTGVLCAPCAEVGRRLRDREVTCGISGCTRKWIWKADEQIVAFAAGKPNEPPRRMCDACRATFGKLADREVRCRTSGCKNTWTWSRFDQLDACVADKPPPKAPSHMCKRCFDLWSTLKDVERPCRRSGCKGTWLDKRGAQLARAVRGKTGDPYPHLCTSCEKELGDLEDREIPCRTENCPGTFTWTREQQLAAGVRPKLKEPEPAVEPAGAPLPEQSPGVLADASPTGAAVAAPEAPAAAVDGTEPTVAIETLPVAANPESAVAAAAPESATPEVGPAAAGAPAQAAPAQGQAGAGKGKKNKRKRRREVQPPERRCPACAEFLANRKTQEIPCSQCGTPIFWPPESQLQTHLGNWAAPTLCGACKLVQVQAAREAAREMLRHGHPQPEEVHQEGEAGDEASRSQPPEARSPEADPPATG